MAVVQTSEVRLDTGRLFKRVVKFSGMEKEKDKRFSCAYPPDVALALGQSNAFAAGLEEAIAAWSDGCKRALEAAKTVARVIVAEIKTKGIIHRDGKLAFSSAGHGYYYSSNKRPRTSELALDLSVGVFDEITMVLGKETRYRYEAVDSSIPRAAYPEIDDGRQREHHIDHVYDHSYGGDENIPENVRLPWTEQGEAWFAGLVTATENLILKLNTLRRDRKALQESIDRGRGLLAAAPE